MSWRLNRGLEGSAVKIDFAAVGANGLIMRPRINADQGGPSKARVQYRAMGDCAIGSQYSANRVAAV